MDGLTSDAAVNLQVAPGEGLYLAAPVFDNYNKYKAQPPQKPKLEWDSSHAKHDVIERFRVEVIEDGIVQGGKAEALLPWVLYPWQVRLFGFPLSVEDPIPVPNPTVDANGRSSFSPAAAEVKFLDYTASGVPPVRDPRELRWSRRWRRRLDAGRPPRGYPLTGKIRGQKLRTRGPRPSA